jgi:hypothetical protein
MKRLTRDLFIKKAIELHGDRYDYSIVEYTNSRSKLRIICPVHGIFEQTSNSHLSGSGCPKCGLKTLTTEDFINKANEIHGNKYDYSKTTYSNPKIKINIICPIHGEFYQIPHSHLEGCGCSKCFFNKVHLNNLSTTEDFINKANEIHGNKYDYSFVDYRNNTTKVKIICPIHGEFYQTPHNHKRGNGCKKCAGVKISNSAIKTSRGWTLTDWLNKYLKTPDSKPRIYVLKCYNDEEEFIKVGITMRDIESRFNNKTTMPYQFKIITDFISTPDNVFKKEIAIKRKYKKQRYIPKISFAGYSECYNISFLTEIIKTING